MSVDPMPFLIRRQINGNTTVQVYQSSLIIVNIVVSAMMCSRLEVTLAVFQISELQLRA